MRTRCHKNTLMPQPKTTNLLKPKALNPSSVRSSVKYILWSTILWQIYVLFSSSVVVICKCRVFFFTNRNCITVYISFMLHCSLHLSTFKLFHWLNVLLYVLFSSSLVDICKCGVFFFTNRKSGERGNIGFHVCDILYLVVMETRTIPIMTISLRGVHLLSRGVK